MLGPVNLYSRLWACCGNTVRGGESMGSYEQVCCGSPESRDDLHWVIAGGESGPGARPAHPDWFRSLERQCRDAGVPFLFKQWGEWAPHAAGAGGDEGGDLRRGHVRYLQGDGREPDGHFRKGDAAVAHVGKKAAGRLLDGVTHDGFPTC
jgi:protein gp37